MKLSQKQGFFNTREFEIVGDVVRVKQKTTSGFKEWAVKIEQLGDQTHSEVEKRGTAAIGVLMLAFTIFFMVMHLTHDTGEFNTTAVLFIAFVMLVYSLILLLIPRKREIHLVGGEESLSFYMNSPTKELVQEFMEVLKAKTRTLLWQKYGKVDPDIPEETMMNQFVWLKNRNVIDQGEYDDLKAEYFAQKLMR